MFKRVRARRIPLGLSIGTDCRQVTGRPDLKIPFFGPDLASRKTSPASRVPTALLEIITP
jgi:hypothetical protein